MPRMPWTEEQKATYLIKVAKEALEKGQDVEEAILEALQFIKKDEEGGTSGL